MMKKPPVLLRLIGLMPVSFPHLLLSTNSVCLNILVGLCYADGGINEGASLVRGRNDVILFRDVFRAGHDAHREDRKTRVCVVWIGSMILDSLAHGFR
jgi:hypothetical protein